MAVLLGTKAQKTVNLTDVGIGQVFRFASARFEDALRDDNFYRRVAQQPQKVDRVLCVSLNGQQLREFDGNHSVIVHEHDILVYPN